MPKVEKKLLTFTEYTAMKAADLFKHVAEVAVKPLEALNKATDKVVSIGSSRCISPSGGGWRPVDIAAARRGAPGIGG